jgi:hypothetical protein
LALRPLAGRGTVFGSERVEASGPGLGYDPTPTSMEFVTYAGTFSIHVV